MKKYLLKLGVIPIATLPLLSVVSCDNELLSAIDLEIKIPKDKHINQRIINSVAETLQIEGLSSSTKADMLNQVFENVDEGKFNHFKIKVEENPSNTIDKIISLEANDGFVFKNSKVLRSQEVKVPGIIDLNIQALGDVDQITIDQAIKDLNSKISLEEKIVPLNTVFSGVTLDNINNFDLDIKSTFTGEKELGIIILTPKPGFSFDGDTILSSWSKGNLNIKPIRKTQEEIDAVIQALFKPHIDNVEKISILSRIFLGVNQENINNFLVDVQITSGTTLGTVTLRAKDGFNFDGNPTLTSLVKLNLAIEAIPKDQKYIDDVINGWKQDLSALEKVNILSTIFEGINEGNINDFDVKVTPTSGSTPGTVTLIAKEGFKFNGKPTLSSQLLVDLKIGHLPIIQAHLDVVIMWLYIGVDPYELLQVPFTGITYENVNNLEVTATPTDGQTLGTIVLTAKKGFTINGQSSIASVTMNENLNIKPIRKSQEEIDSVIQALYKKNIPSAEKISILSRIFSGIDEDNIDDFLVDLHVTSGSTPGTVTLKAKNGFTFDGNPTLTSLVKLNLAIEAIPKDQNYIDDVINGWKQDLSAPEKVNILSTIFEGINEGNIDDFDVKVTPTLGSTPGIVTLIAKEGIKFNGKPTLSSQLLVDLKIGHLPIIQAHLDVVIMWLYIGVDPYELLQVPFTGITYENVNNLEVTATPTDGQTLGTIVLKAKPGFTINGQSSIMSVIVNENLNIKPIRKSQEEIDSVIQAFLNPHINSAEKIRVLSRIFSGIDEDNIDDFLVDIHITSGTTPGTVTLKAKKGFTFDGNPTLTSLVKLNLAIKAIPKDQNYIDDVIKGWKQDLSAPEKVKILSTIFEGINEGNINYFDVKVTPTSGSTPGTVTLIAKEGIKFNGKQTLSSQLLVDLKIGHLPIIQAHLDVVIMWLYIGVDPYELLQVPFTGITYENVNNLEVIATPTDGQTLGTIVLKAKPGFTINGQSSIVSVTMNENLNIKPIKKPQSEIDAVIQALYKKNIPSAEKISILSRIFSGIDEDNIDDFLVDIHITSGTTPGTVTLKAKKGFTFDGQPSIVSVTSDTSK